jgi:hypothetical protein
VTRGFRAATLILCALVLAGCIAPLRQREAETRAGRSLRNFCQNKACGTARLIKSQKLKDRWLVDFESPTGLYTVAVDQGGNTDISVWDK